MAHITRFCESAMKRLHRTGRKALALRHMWRQCIPGCCPLCGASTRSASLCRCCQRLVVADMWGDTLRCDHCCLALSGPGPCPDCEQLRPAFDRIIAAFDYVEPANFLIHRLKVARRFTDVPVLAGLLVDEVRRAWPEIPPDVILVPVPASRQGLVNRGFNPAAELARSAARQLQLTCRPGILVREHGGQKQSTLGREARLIATARLYRVALDVTNARIAVVDDVMTTGSTMHSIARMLKRSGARSVHGLVVARTPHISS